MRKDSTAKENLIIYLSMILIFISVYLFMSQRIGTSSDIHDLVVKSIDTRNISVVKISYKNGAKNDKEILKDNTVSNSNPSEQKNGSVMQQINNAPKIKWQLPTKVGRITTYPNYNHVAFDITSARGVNETIYPIADGTVSGIYCDSAGAKIVTVHHYIDGLNYTSQYVHLSSYAPGLYVGKPVTTNDPLGQMGRTGIATGVHLHIAVTDCILFNPDDDNCKDLNGFYRYLRLRYTQGFTGLNNLINVPYSW